MLSLKHKYIKYLAMLLSGGIAIFAFLPFDYHVIIVVSILLFLWVINNPESLKNQRQVLFLGYVFGLSYFNTQLYWIFYSIYYVIGAKFIVGLIAQIGFSVFLASYIALATLSYVRLRTK